MSTKRNPTSESAQGSAAGNEKSWTNGTFSTNQRPGHAFLKQLHTPSSRSLEMLVGADDNCWVAPGQSYPQKKLDGRSWSDVGMVPPGRDSCTTARVATPTRRITQTAIRRKQQSDKAVEPELDWREFTHRVAHSRDGTSSKAHSESLVKPLYSEDWKVSLDSKLQTERVDANLSASRATSGVRQSVHADDEGDTGQSCDESTVDGAGHDCGEGHETGEQKTKTAPSDLLLEFLQCLMKKDYANAEKLCRIILIYEPNNPEALKFHPLILEKIELDRKDASEDKDTDEDDSSGEESSESSGSSSESSDDSSGVDSFDNFLRPDSGIGM